MPDNGYTLEIPSEVGKDGHPILYVDESGCRVRNIDGNYYVLGGIMTYDINGLNRLVRSVKAKHYPGRKVELKSRNIRRWARSDLLEGIADLDYTKIVIHAVVKNRIRVDRYLLEQHRFYKNTYNNLIKLALKGHTESIHVVTDQHYTSEEQFEHFKNSIGYVNGWDRVLSITPVSSMKYGQIQAADVVSGTARKRLCGENIGEMFFKVGEILVRDEDVVFPRSTFLKHPLWI